MEPKYKITLDFKYIDSSEFSNCIECEKDLYGKRKIITDSYDIEYKYKGTTDWIRMKTFLNSSSHLYKYYSRWTRFTFCSKGCATKYVSRTCKVTVGKFAKL